MVCIYTEPPIDFQVKEVKHWLAESEDGVKKLEGELIDNTYADAYDIINTEHTKAFVNGNEVLVVYNDESRPKLDGQGVKYVPMVNRLPGEANYDPRDFHFQCVDNGLPDYVTPEDCETEDVYNEQLEIVQEAAQNQQDEEREKQAERQAELESQPGYQMLQLFGAMANLKNQQDAQLQKAQQQTQQEQAGPAPSSSN
jgi:hypothetical protein